MNWPFIVVRDGAKTSLVPSLFLKPLKLAMESIENDKLIDINALIYQQSIKLLTKFNLL